jgi:GNAT superfamily N-acetyltransferase
MWPSLLRSIDTHVMSMTCIVRAAAPVDLPALRELFLSSRRRTFTWLRMDTFRLDDFDAQTEGERMLVAEVGQDIAGFISVWEPDDFIHHLFVDAAHARRGIGRALLRALPGWPDRTYRLKCLSRNRAALAFYGAQGFVQIDHGVGGDGDYVVLSRGGADQP